MKNKITYLIIASLLIITMINSASAVNYWQTKELINNDTTKIHAVLFWDFAGLTEDYIKSGHKYEVSVMYDFYPKTWNQQNTNYSVEYCNLSIKFSPKISNTSQTLYERTIYPTEEDISRAEYFIKLEQGDGIFIDANCLFSGTRPQGLEIPSTITIITPTWECKACQYYEWNTIIREVQNTIIIGNNVTSVWTYIKKLVIINLEIIIALFWVILTALLLFAISLIFIGIYYLFLILRRITR